MKKIVLFLALFLSFACLNAQNDRPVKGAQNESLNTSMVELLNNPIERATQGVAKLNNMLLLNQHNLPQEA